MQVKINQDYMFFLIFVSSHYYQGTMVQTSLANLDALPRISTRDNLFFTLITTLTRGTNYLSQYTHQRIFSV